MRTPIQNVSLAFTRLRDPDLVEFTDVIEMNLYPQEIFSAPPVTLAELQSAKDLFAAALAAMAQGGTAATATKNTRRAELLALLKQLALYVEVTSNNILETLLSSGFSAVSKNRVSEQLLPPDSVKTRNGLMGQSLTNLGVVKNARGYEMQYAPVDENGTQGVWIDVPFQTSSRDIAVNGLVSGKVYFYRGRAMGGLTGASDWSEVTSHRAY